MTQIPISWRKLQFHDANHNFMTHITISWRKLLFHDGHERNDRQTHHCDTGRQVDLPGNLDPTCVELCMCVGWVQVTRPLSVSIQMIVQRAADNQPSGWCGKRSADIIFVGYVTPLHQPCPRVPCPQAQLSAPGVSRAWLKTAHAHNTEIGPPETRPARDVKPPQKVRNCTICRHMPLPVRATLTGVTTWSTRGNSFCKQDWINN